MGENTKISWAHHSQNFWIGCTKVSPGCANCYAETQQDLLYHRVRWGKGQPRHITKTWKDPLRWNKEARTLGVRYRVFTNSLSDMFDEEVSDELRDKAFEIIFQCESLDWLILTKRVQKAKDYLATVKGWPWPNVWLGASVENQEAADYRIPVFLGTPAALHFLSIEPLLGPIDLNLYNMIFLRKLSFSKIEEFKEQMKTAPTKNFQKAEIIEEEVFYPLDWVIVGGESGDDFRKMRPEWAMSLFSQCQEYKIPFFMKQGSGPNPGQQYDLSDGLFSVKEFPKGVYSNE